jgi:hypothetical protein
MGRPMDATCPFKFVGETTGEPVWWCQRCGCIGFAYDKWDKPLDRQTLVDVEYPTDTE